MASKDINELLTKDGCGRVYSFKTTGLVHCYTMEMGYHGQQQKGGNSSKVFNIQDYKNHGIAILLAIAQLYDMLSINSSPENTTKIENMRE